MLRPFARLWLSHRASSRKVWPCADVVLPNFGPYGTHGDRMRLIKRLALRTIRPFSLAISVPLVLAASLASAPTAFAAPADPASAEASASADGPGEDPPLVSPEAVRDLGVSPEASEPEEVGNPTSFAPRASRNTIRLAKYIARSGDTLRAVAYRYFTTPSLLAAVNKLAFGPEADPVLPAGETIQVPIARGSPSGFDQGEQLLPGPGMHMSPNLERKWGRPQVVRLFRQAFTETFKRWPQRHPALIGSLSKAGGGKLGRHKSHRSGQDIDVGYFTREGNRKEWGRPSVKDMDMERTWFLVDYLEQTGHVAAIFMAPDVQKGLYTYAAGRGVKAERLRALFQYGPPGRANGSLIRHSPGHRDHMHIRLWVPEDMPEIRADRAT